MRISALFPKATILLDQLEKQLHKYDDGESLQPEQLRKSIDVKFLELGRLIERKQLSHRCLMYWF